MTTRRIFLQVSTSIAATMLLRGTMLGASIAALQPADSPHTNRLSDGWEYWQGTMGGAWEVWHSEETSVWNKVAMPHSFNMHDACDPDTPYYQGQGWYRTWLDVKNPYTQGRTLLHFEGCGQRAEIYIGTTLAGKHTGGYDEFVVDITDAIATWQKTADAKSKAKGVPLAVLCDNSRDLDRIPSDLSDFSLYGGLYRHLNLVYVPSISISNVHVKTEIPTPISAAKITVLAELYTKDAQQPVELSIVIRDAKGRELLHDTKKITATTEPIELLAGTLAKPELWAPDTPHLYTCTVTLKSGSDSTSAQTNFGIKHTEFLDHGPFKLNGERLLLRGTHRHEDHAGFANALPDSEIDEELHLVKAMGCNFIRLAHYQQSRRVLDLCDKLGILVWEELPWCRGGVGPEGDPHTAAFKDMGREKLRNMIAQHYNHPSVLFWGLGNEDDWPTEYPSVDHEAIRAFMSELNELAHQLDPSRYTSFRRCDFARDIPDVYSPSIWAGWYSGTYPEYQKSLETQRERVKHLIHIEWGADSHAGRHSENPDKVLAKIATGHGTDERGLAYLSTGGEARVSKDGDWSETYACNLFDWHLKVQETLDWLTGSAMWVFKDFTTPLRVENPVPRINQKGVLARDMTKKEAFYVFQSYWAKEPMAHIYGHTWPVRWGQPGEEKMVKVYSNCDTAELYLNGKSLGTKKRDSQDFPCAGLRWMTPFLDGENKLRVVAKKGSATVTDEVNFEYQTKKWGKPAKLKLSFLGNDGPRGYVEATLHDQEGVLCLDAKNVIQFSVLGGSKLRDNQGTPWGSRVVQLCNGRARIWVEYGSTVGTIAVESDAKITAASLLLGWDLEKLGEGPISSKPSSR